jgi:hypothetical protein
MLVRNKKAFNMGGLLSLSFFGVLFLIFSPIFNGKNGLVFSDDLFNKLSKGSSYFIPAVTNNVKKFVGKPFSITIKMDKPEAVQQAVKMLAVVPGMQAEPKGGELTVKGDLGDFLANILVDSDAMYNNNGEKIFSKYQMDEREVMSTWWSILNKMDKELKKQKSIEESNIVSEVSKKGIEPAFNFYKIDAQSVADKAVTMTGLLVFYVVYTMWWGFAIFYLFDGLGLSMKKAKVKKEV